jgi:ABC-type metal ion transport system substrate-binding protein
MSYKSITDFIKPTIITAQQYGTKVSVEIDHSDTDIDELMDAFQTLVIGLGYHDSAWKNWIVDRAAEYHEQDTEDLKATLNQWSEDEVSDIVFHSDVKLTDKEIDEAFAQHNAHEEGFDLDEDEYDDYGQLIEPNEALKKAAKKYKKNKKK